MTQIVGAGRHRYAVDNDWAKLPPGIEMKAAAVTVDDQDRVFCFNRVADHPVLVFDRDGTFLDSWGAALFGQPHAIANPGLTPARTMLAELRRSQPAAK